MQTFTPVAAAKPNNTFAKQVVTAIAHVADDPAYETQAGTPTYTSILTVIPAATIATPHRTQRRPRINGQQVAQRCHGNERQIQTEQVRSASSCDAGRLTPLLHRCGPDLFQGSA